MHNSSENKSSSSPPATTDDPVFTPHNLHYLRNQLLTAHLRIDTRHTTTAQENDLSTFFQASLPNPEHFRAAIGLIKSMVRQKTRRAITNYDLFSSYFASGGFDGRKSIKSTYIDLNAGLQKLGINTYGTHDSAKHLFTALDAKNRGYFTLKELITAMNAYEAYASRLTNSSSGTSVTDYNKRIKRSLREDQVRKSFERIARSPTESSLRWKSSQLYHRTFESHNESCDDDKDHDPRKLLANLSEALSRRALRDWDIFMICDDDRNGSVTPMEFANGLHKLHFNYTPRQLKRLWEAIDMDRSGRIEFDELRLALSMAANMGSNTLPNNQSGGKKSGGKRENGERDRRNNRTKRVHAVIPQAERKEDGEKEGEEEQHQRKAQQAQQAQQAQKEPEEKKETQRVHGDAQGSTEMDERTKTLIHRAFIVRKKIANPRLKVLLSKMRAAISSWYNHDRRAFLTRHGRDRINSHKDTKKDGNNNNSGGVTSGGASGNDVDNSRSGNITERMNALLQQQQSIINSTPSSNASSTEEECRMTIGRAKQQLRTMVPFTTKEMHAYISLLGIHYSLDDEITLAQFDQLLHSITQEMKHALGPPNVHSPQAQYRQRHQGDTFLIEGSITDIAESIGSEPTNVPSRSTALIAKPIAIHLDHVIHKMQHQAQRCELFNESLFSGVDFEVSTIQSLRLQFNLLGYSITLNEMKALQNIFGGNGGASAIDLHYCLICRKLQNACYSVVDDTILTNLAEHDSNGDGCIEISMFVKVVASHLSLQLVETEALYNILMSSAPKEEKNRDREGPNHVCRYLDMFMRSPVMCHGKVLKDVWKMI